MRWALTTFPVIIAISGCTSSTPVENVFDTTLARLALEPRSASAERGNARIASNASSAKFKKVVSEGTGSFVSSRAPATARGRTVTGANGYTLTLVDAPIPIAAKNVLGDILSVDYVVDPRVQGRVSLSTSQPVSKDAMVDAFEAALAVSDAAIVQQGKLFKIVPLSEAISSGAPISVPSVTPRGPGVRVQVIELRFTAADEMRNILEPISREGAIVRVDKSRNHLVLAGTAQELASMRDAISVFDVDWMRGMSVALHPLKASAPQAVADELTTVFAARTGPGKDLIQFVPNQRLNAVLIITSRPALLDRAAVWIRKLDRLADANEKQLFVYQIQNRPAKELADVLQSVLSSNDMAATTARDVAPDLVATSISTDDEASTSGQSTSAVVTSDVGGKVSVVADVENNALLISTTQREFDRVEKILRQLDVLPTQVLIEAVIAEVTLNDELKFGLRWAIESGNFSFGLSDLASGFAGANFPGFSWGFSSPDVRVTLNALNSVTDVNVISSPTLMAMNNQKAILQVGDQVPIVTQTSASTQSGSAPVINTVELKDTGIILTIQPRVNRSGRVMLNIDQEASNVVQTTTSGIDSPTIQQRRLSTRVVVSDGQSIALGGLIQERNTLSRGQVPLLGDIPLLGNAFKNKTDAIRKTELIIFVRPRVVRSTHEARDITAEFKGKLRLRTAITKRRGGADTTEQNVRRLVY